MNKKDHALREIKSLIRNSGRTNVLYKSDIEEIIKDIDFKELEDEE